MSGKLTLKVGGDSVEIDIEAGKSVRWLKDEFGIVGVTYLNGRLVENEETQRVEPGDEVVTVPAAHRLG